MAATGDRPMADSNSGQIITSAKYDAVLFDLDGVITDTAGLHAACWKQMFDDYLQKRAAQRGEEFQPFALDVDYRLYVDGKPRFDGAVAPVFLLQLSPGYVRGCFLPGLGARSFLSPGAYGPWI
jgi:hypothetical protein